MIKESHAYIGLAIAFAGGVALGGGLGYFVTVKRMQAQYDADLEAEIERTKQFYSRVHKADDFADPVSAAEALGVDIDEAPKDLQDATDALRKYQGIKTAEEDGTMMLHPDEKYDYSKEPAESEELVQEIKQNVFDLHNDDEVFYANRERNQARNLPYVINDEEWMGNEPQHEQVSLTWYADNMLADDSDMIVDDIRIIGQDNLELFGIGSSHPNVVMVRNEKLHMDYEVTKSEQKFEHVVAGFTEELKHSDDNVRRLPRRPRWNDE